MTASEDVTDVTRRAGVVVRSAADATLADVSAVLDGAALATDADALADALARDDVLVARPASQSPREEVVVARPTNRSPGDEVASGPLVGVLVLDGDRITHVAVRPGRRGQGIGSALVRAAARRRDRLVAAHDDGVAPFYRSLGFDLRRQSDGRWLATLDPATPGTM